MGRPKRHSKTAKTEAIGDRLAVRVRELREAQGWTREKLAAESGVSYQTVQRLESGRVPRLENLVNIANTLRVTVDSLVG